MWKTSVTIHTYATDWIELPIGKPVGIGMAGEAPSSTDGTELVTTPGVERRVKKGNQPVYTY